MPKARGITLVLRTRATSCLGHPPLDTHGFAMLSQLRSYYPRTESFLMDRETLLAFRKLWGTEPTDKRCIAELPNLNDEERQLYEELRDNVVGENVRLEQERIGFQCLCERLRE